MKRFRFAAVLLMAAGCAAPASDAVLLRGAALDTLPDGWFLWRKEPRQFGGEHGGFNLADGRVGLLIYADGRAEAVSQNPPMFAEAFAGRKQRGSGEVSAADRAALEKAAAGPLSPPIRPERKLRGGFEPETDWGARYQVEIRGADGGVRRVSYEFRAWNEGSSGGEPLHPLVMRILRGLLE